MINDIVDFSNSIFWLGVSTEKIFLFVPFSISKFNRRHYVSSHVFEGNPLSFPFPNDPLLTFLVVRFAKAPVGTFHSRGFLTFYNFLLTSFSSWESYFRILRSTVPAFWPDQSMDRFYRGFFFSTYCLAFDFTISRCFGNGKSLQHGAPRFIVNVIQFDGKLVNYHVIAFTTNYHLIRPTELKLINRNWKFYRRTASAASADESCADCFLLLIRFYPNCISSSSLEYSNSYTFFFETYKFEPPDCNTN